MWQTNWAGFAVALLIAGCAGPQQQASTSTEDATKPPRAAARPENKIVSANRQPKRNAAIEQAKAAIAAQLQDPASASFTDVEFKSARNGTAEPTHVVCGMINVRSSEGASSEAMPFVYLVDVHDPRIVDGQEIVAEAVYRRLCLGRTD